MSWRDFRSRRGRGREEEDEARRDPKFHDYMNTRET